MADSPVITPKVTIALSSKELGSIATQGCSHLSLNGMNLNAVDFSDCEYLAKFIDLRGNPNLPIIDFIEELSIIPATAKETTFIDHRQTPDANYYYDGKWLHDGVRVIVRVDDDSYTCYTIDGSYDIQPDISLFAVLRGTGFVDEFLTVDNVAKYYEWYRKQGDLIREDFQHMDGSLSESMAKLFIKPQSKETNDLIIAHDEAKHATVKAYNVLAAVQKALECAKASVGVAQTYVNEVYVWEIDQYNSAMDAIIPELQ